MAPLVITLPAGIRMFFNDIHLAKAVACELIMQPGGAAAVSGELCHKRHLHNRRSSTTSTPEQNSDDDNVQRSLLRAGTPSKGTIGGHAAGHCPKENPKEPKGSKPIVTDATDFGGVFIETDLKMSSALNGEGPERCILSPGQNAVAAPAVGHATDFAGDVERGGAALDHTGQIRRMPRPVSCSASHRRTRRPVQDSDDDVQGIADSDYSDANWHGRKRHLHYCRGGAAPPPEHNSDHDSVQRPTSQAVSPSKSTTTSSVYDPDVDARARLGAQMASLRAGMDSMMDSMSKIHHLP